MPPSTRIPPLLRPHTRYPKEDSIILITSTLGASANWLIVRFLHEAFSHDPTTENVENAAISGDETEPISVILVSWMRDLEFWKAEARKGGGLDLERLKRDKRFAFVDGMSKLYLPKDDKGKLHATQASRHPATQTLTGSASRNPQTALPVRGPISRAPMGTLTTARTVASTTSATTAEGTPSGQFNVTALDMGTLKSTIENACQHIRADNPQHKLVLILDSPSLLLASNPAITPTMLSALLLQLHGLLSHVIIHLPTDDALLSLSTPPQPLEIDGRNFLVKTAHMSSRILSCRVLDTGVAKDVSGVLQITENEIGYRLVLSSDDGRADEAHNRELLYLVKGDGNVKVFERGTGGEA